MHSDELMSLRLKIQKRRPWIEFTAEEQKIIRNGLRKTLGWSKEHMINLEGVDWRGADLRGAQLGPVNFNGAILSDADLTKAQLSGSKLNGVEMLSARLVEAQLAKSGLVNAHLDRAECQKANFKEANLASATLQNAKYERAHFEGANLSKCDLTEASFTAAHCRAARFKKATISEVDFDGADLRKANFYRAHGSKPAMVIGARFGGASLSGVKPDLIEPVDSCETHALLIRTVTLLRRFGLAWFVAVSAILFILFSPDEIPIKGINDVALVPLRSHARSTIAFVACLGCVFHLGCLYFSNRTCSKLCEWVPEYDFDNKATRTKINRSLAAIWFPEQHFQTAYARFCESDVYQMRMYFLIPVGLLSLLLSYTILPSLGLLAIILLLFSIAVSGSFSAHRQLREIRHQRQEIEVKRWSDHIPLSLPCLLCLFMVSAGVLLSVSGLSFAVEAGPNIKSARNFAHQSLLNHNFNWAQLENVLFSGSKLSGATFHCASISGADFRESDLTAEQLRQARWLSPPKLPPHLQDVIQNKACPK